MQVNSKSPEDSVVESLDDKVKAKRKLVEDLKAQWNLLWTERFDDKVRAEGISLNDYASLRIEQGTVIHATRDFKPLSFKDILDLHLAGDSDRFTQPDASVGGWSNFVKTKITSRKPQSKRAQTYVPLKREVQQHKKGGRGWLHAT